MGNRAVLNTGGGIGIYLHWNGGRASVEGFLQAAEKLGLRSDEQYFPARLCQVIGNYFGGTCSVGIGTLDQLDRDNGDNGEYVIKDGKIVGRNYFDCEEEIDPPKTRSVRDACLRYNRRQFKRGAM